MLPCTLFPTDYHNIAVLLASQMLSQRMSLNIREDNNLYKVRPQNVASKTTYIASTISHHHPTPWTRPTAQLHQFKFLWRREKGLEVSPILIYFQWALLRGLCFLRIGFRKWHPNSCGPETICSTMKGAKRISMGEAWVEQQNLSS